MPLELPSSSIYYEALWVLALFAGTACLREAIGELCTHKIARRILSCSHIHGSVLDVFSSCSNGGRSLGFGAAWRLWNVDKERVAIQRWVIILPFLCWAVGLPIKLISVEAVRGGNAFLGPKGTWALGISWIMFCVIVKVAAIIVDRVHGLRDNDGKLVSFRRIFQLRVCTFEGMGMMNAERMQEYDQSRSFLKPTPTNHPLGVDIQWVHAHSTRTPASSEDQDHQLLEMDAISSSPATVLLRMTATRQPENDGTPNGIDAVLSNHDHTFPHPHWHLH
eukprot:TRINITY_DN2794_c0_g1_i2.p1 TRINITY_DN2794_c0_g1~~TRINITY_DN2794_c0_g1_i2.p1  ORF type:complete len:278 (-),score=41.36 TRINITY_DN2794_c0_g1_i2:8-841(-)